MKHIILSIVIVFVGYTALNAQQFIQAGTIEYELKYNLKKNMNGEDFWDQMMMEKVPEFKVGYFTLTFDKNKSIFKFDRWKSKDGIPQYLLRSDEETFYYTDFVNQKYYYLKSLYGNNFDIADNLQKAKWQINSETRDIAGFKCRKATTVLFDSVYVFAFYTDEIVPPVGPITLHGLPGAIMGITIPRLYTSYVATKVTVAGVKPPTEPKIPSKAMTKEAYLTFVEGKAKEWFRWGDDAEQRKKAREKFLWEMQL